MVPSPCSTVPPAGCPHDEKVPSALSTILGVNDPVPVKGNLCGNFKTLGKALVFLPGGFHQPF